MTKQRAQIDYLLRQVEIYHARPVRTTVDFETLSTVVEHQTSERISASTLKRLWGYVSDIHAPRRYTLDVLSKYIGHKNFDEFCEHSSNQNPSNSDFITPLKILSDDLVEGTQIEIGWSPNRCLVLEYLGERRFSVLQSQNSKIEAGDEFMCTTFMLRYPLYIASVTRGKEILPAFVGGRNGGLTILSVL